MARSKWQYRTVIVDVEQFWGPKVDPLSLDRTLNDLGESQWELITSFSTNAGGGTTKDVVLIFKREIPEDED